MKTLRRLSRYSLIVATLATPALLAARVRLSQGSTKHHHYKLIDMGTFGGPQSYFNSLNLTDGFGFGTVFYNVAQVRNARGQFVGFADTMIPDPYPAFCYVPECYVTHAFKFEGGTKTDLGALPGGGSSAPFWINARGWITGNSQNGEMDPFITGLPEVRAVLWKGGTVKDLGTLGGSQSFSQAINDRGQITGLALNDISDPYSYFYEFLYLAPNGTQTRAFVWDEKEGMQDIGTLGGPDAFPSLINQHGQVAGFSYTNWIPNPTTGLPTFDPFLWETGKGMKDLGGFGGTQAASVNGLNEKGEVVGGSYLPGDVQIHPFLWDGSKLIDLTAPPFGGSGDGEASWINDAGEVVGVASLPAPCPGGTGYMQHAFLWRNGTVTDLDALSTTSASEAVFINSKSQIVGMSFACDSLTSSAFLWEQGSIVDLNTLISSDSDFQLVWAGYISDNGEIGAFGNLSNGDTHAVLLIPCDENHPGIEGCDYSMTGAEVQGETPLTPVLVPLSLEKAATAPPRLRLRTIGVARRARSQAATENPSSRTEQSDFIGERLLSNSGGGLCDVDYSTEKLTGHCTGSNGWVCFSKSSSQCPTGEKAVHPQSVQMGFICHPYVDTTRSCAY